MNQGLQVLSAVGAITRVFSVLMLLPILVAFAYEPWDTSIFGWIDVPRNALVFLVAFVVTAAFAFPEGYLTRHIVERDLPDRAAYLTVGVGWVVLTLFGMLPFLFSGVLSSPVDAFFETMSGFTTTGASVISGSLEDVPPSIMMWRGFLQYLGGMGMIVLSVALLSRLTHGGMQLLQAEAPGPSVKRIAPKLANTATMLWSVYALLSGALMVILTATFLAKGMPWMDAVYDGILHTFTTMSTGGFSNHSTSIAHYESVLVEVVLIIFMLMAASNFTLHYYVLHGDWRILWKDSEWRFLMASFFGVTLVITGMLVHAGEAAGAGLRSVAFTIASIVSTTGFATVDFDVWPDAGKMLLMVLMFTGGSAGSTAGGLKHMRILLLIKLVRRELNRLLHPRAVMPIRFGGKAVDEKTLWAVVAFFFSFITVWLIGALAIIYTDPHLGLLDGAAAAASAAGNIGPAFGIAGPTGGYWNLLPSTKLILSALMWLGRLEIFTVLLIFDIRAWR